MEDFVNIDRFVAATYIDEQHKACKPLPKGSIVHLMEELIEYLTLEHGSPLRALGLQG